MKVHYNSPKAKIVHGDSLEVLKHLPENSIHSVVTDPPYAISLEGKSGSGPGGMLGQIAEGNEMRQAFAYGGTHSRGIADNDPKAFQAWCEQWAAECLRVLKPGGVMLAFGATRTFHRLAAGMEDAGFEIRDAMAWLYASGMPKGLDIGKKSPDLSGWHTSLRPQYEPIVAGRKPFSERTANLNMDTWGVGAYHISAAADEKGRHTGNVVLGEDAARVLEEQQKGASTYYFVPKPSGAERPKVDGVSHSTVKPLSLMRHLIKLVTPPGGLVLDPFAGSGTTVEAAILDGFRGLGIEQEASYLPLIDVRLARSLTATTAEEVQENA